MAEEERPGLHVTPPTGWLNDPVGGFVLDGRYHLFFQHVPSRPTWDVACHWGHVVGDDLVRWRHVAPALVPEPGEDGCWSGSAVVVDGAPVLHYTSVVVTDLDAGRIVVVDPLDAGDPDLVRWQRRAGPVVMAPPDLGLTAFRDPEVFGRPGAWRMLVGAGTVPRGDGTGGSGALVSYTSPDLRTYELDGLLAEGEPGDGLGAIWECPHLAEVDGAVALVLSVLAADGPGDVVAAVGALEDGRFRGGRWRTLGHGGSAYAMTTFRDGTGRLCAMAWLRHDGEHERSTWEGVLSLPQEVRRRDDRLLLSPHPDVDTLRCGRLAVEADGTVELPEGWGDLEVDLAPGDAVRARAVPHDIAFERTRDGLRVAAGERVVEVALEDGALRLRLVVDRGALEAWTDDGQWTALRVPYLRVDRLRMEVDGPAAAAATAWRLDPVQLDGAQLDAVPVYGVRRSG